MMERMEQIQVMSVFMITMDRLGCKLVKTLMGKPQVTKVAILFLYLLTDQG
jgi:hypothetical protein